ncbi:MULTISPECIES: 4Fe-4S dicluster domain-containing protein [Azospirillum]|uniref:Hydrogenase n=1 Tax=Azospirillum humicireducens TaxID=1226968 RepID=A0A2R4VSA9_9PROT|nr:MULTISPECIES: 4Fe-4S dicluster domain-containing protein [Azospirillum]AWB07338.1 hydrogenase [Azospirillum humicireducens]HYF88749.1 4Fe-4S dicluster domain-containing protein [Azospirillum sp.]
MNRFVIAEPRKCIGCNTCMAACTEAHKKQGLQAHPRLTVMRIGDDTGPVLCHQCEDAPCARVCPVNAITHAADAILLDEQACIGCKMCALACPFGAITPSGTGIAGVAGIATATPSHSAALDPLLAWDIGVRSVAVKCDLCAFSGDGPACVRVCPTAALYAADADATRQAAAVKRTLAAAAPVSPETPLASLEGLDP